MSRFWCRFFILWALFAVLSGQVFGQPVDHCAPLLTTAGSAADCPIADDACKDQCCSGPTTAVFSPLSENLPVPRTPADNLYAQRKNLLHPAEYVHLIDYPPISPPVQPVARLC